jgi:seryl-tRNA(Sec) selenium transferase
VGCGLLFKKTNFNQLLFSYDNELQIQKQNIASVRNHTYPNEGWARGFKVSKEQIVGLVTALEIFLHEGDAQYEQQMATARYLLKTLEDIAHFDVQIIPNDETFH